MRALLLCLLALSGCNMQQQAGEPRYLVGGAYETGGVMRYPREDFAYDDTGIAMEAPSSTVRQTANGEANDPTALIAAHRTLQLPAIVEVTNLENGRQIRVRVNDRGPANPARVIALSRRATLLLAPADPRAFRVRVRVVPDESRRAANALINKPGAAPVPEAPRIQVAAAPRGGVASESLAPPPGVGARAGGPVVSLPTPVAAAPVAAEAEVPMRLPEALTAVYVRPGQQLLVECGAFFRPDAANVLRQRIARLNPRVVTDYNAPRDNAYLVRLGPFATLAQAEAALQQALGMGVPDARIIVD